MGKFWLLFRTHPSMHCVVFCRGDQELQLDQCCVCKSKHTECKSVCAARLYTSPLLDIFPGTLEGNSSEKLIEPLQVDACQHQQIAASLISVLNFLYSGGVKQTGTVSYPGHAALLSSSYAACVYWKARRQSLPCLCWVYPAPELCISGFGSVTDSLFYRL